MLAVVQDQDGEPVTMHRTFLKPDGSGKAEMEAPRRLMPGPNPKGSSVRLHEWLGSGPLCIAEGIETAFAASALFGVPVWAALNAGQLEAWERRLGAPRCLSSVTIMRLRQARWLPTASRLDWHEGISGLSSRSPQASAMTGPMSF